MADSRQRDVSSTRRSRNPRSVSPVISFSERQVDAQARSALDREAKKATQQGDAQSEDELPQGGATQAPLEPHGSAPSPFPAKTAFLTFVADRLRDDKSLTTDALVEQCYAHFNLYELGTVRDDIRPHIADIHDEVANPEVLFSQKSVKNFKGLFFLYFTTKKKKEKLERQKYVKISMFFF